MDTLRLELASLDISSLLIDFLSTILTLSYENKAIFCFDKDIKAVTYHEAEVKKNDQGKYETTIVFDI